MNILGIDLSNSDLWLLGFAGAVISIFIVHRLTIGRSRRQNFIDASVKFNKAILEIFEGYYPHPTSWPKDGIAIDPILRTKFNRISSAISEFRPLIPFYKKWLFDKAWFNYRSGKSRKIDIQNYQQYIAFSGQPDPKQTFHNNIHKLLSFSKFK